MGFSISWIAFKDASKVDVLHRTGLVDSGTEDEVNESPFSLAELPNNWVVLFSNDFDFASAKLLSKLSKGGTVLSCRVEEHVMFSAASCYVDGQEAWSVTHDSQRGIYDLATRGTTPPQLAHIRDRLITEQDGDGGERAGVDHIFDVPVELAAQLTGYRHYSSEFDWGQPHFTRADASSQGLLDSPSWKSATVKLIRLWLRRYRRPL